MKSIMKTMLATVAVAALSVGVALPSANADDSELVSRSAKGLSSYQVFQSAGSELTDGQTLATKLRGSDVGVVVIPQSSVEAKTAQELAAEIRVTSGVRYSTVIVIIDGASDFFGVSSAKKEVEDRAVSYLGKGSVKDAGWELNQNAGKLTSIESDLAKEAATEVEKQAEEINKAEKISLLVKLLPLFISMLLSSIVFLFVKNLSGRTRNQNDPKRYGFRKMPKSLRESVTNFRKTAALHEKLSSRVSLYAQCEELVARFVELETKMSHIESTDPRRMILEVEYVERLDKLTEAIGSDYYLSIVGNPTHWEDASKKAKRVKDAVIALRQQILESIKQINDSSNLEFKIALDSIIGDKTVKVEDLYKK